MYPDEFLQRFWDKVEKRGQDDCWLWMASTDTVGYGHIGLRGKLVLAHRVSYSLDRGPIPDGYHIDHICRVRKCVNPRHLRVVTRKQNMEHKGVQSNSSTGVRGVYRDSRSGKFLAQVRHEGKTIHVGYFTDLDAADRAVRAKRNAVFTHNDLDRTKCVKGV